MYWTCCWSVFWSDTRALREAAYSVVSIPTLTEPVLGQYINWSPVLGRLMHTEWNCSSWKDIPSIVRCPRHCTFSSYKKVDVLGPVSDGSGHWDCGSWSRQAYYHKSFQRHARHIEKDLLFENVVWWLCYVHIDFTCFCLSTFPARPTMLSTTMLPSWWRGGIGISKLRWVGLHFMYDVHKERVL